MNEARRGLALRLKMFTCELFVFEAISGSEEDFIRSNEPKMGSANKRGGGEPFFFLLSFFGGLASMRMRLIPSTLFRSQETSSSSLEVVLP